VKGQFLPIGSTESGNPVCCAIAMKSIDIYVDERIPEHVADVGTRARSRMEKEFLPLPHVGDIDGLGLMLAVEIVTDKASKGIPKPRLADIVQQRGFERGAMLRIVGNRLSYAPPCTITQAESDRALDIISSVLAELKPRSG
jgi:adenosylmethionine-8-amino-7-oxononanoate aminotransferase